MLTEKDIVIISVDRSNPDVIVVNTAVDFVHCPIRLPKSMLRGLGYTVYRPVKVRPIVNAVVFRQAERHGGQIPFGGIAVDLDDTEGLPFNPVAKSPAGNSGGQSK